MVALIIEPNMNPSAMPIDKTPFAKPSCRLGNQMPHALIVFIVTSGDMMPSKSTVANSEGKSYAKPRSAPSAPINTPPTVRMRFGPSRSPSAPHTKSDKMLGKEPKPQIKPTCTRFKPRSVEISLNKTVIQINGAAATHAFVSVARVRMYHL